MKRKSLETIKGLIEMRTATLLVELDEPLMPEESMYHRLELVTLHEALKDVEAAIEADDKINEIETLANA